ncbi:MAG: efflux RND transporter permease subunit, partial [Planctomycetota bacterium]
MELLVQVLVNGLMLGAIYACIAVGFSLVWGVLNVINMLHGSLIILAGYLTFFAWQKLGIHPLLGLIGVTAVLFAFGYLIQHFAINRVVEQPVLVTLTLTFGLDMILYNVMNVAFEATPRRITLDLGSLSIGNIFLPWDRLVAMTLALLLTGVLYLVLRQSRIGRAIVAVRMDRDAATLLGINVRRIYATTFAIGAAMAGACGALFAITFPVTTETITEASQFDNMIVRAENNGAQIVRVKDIGSSRLGAQSYSLRTNYEGKPATLIAVYQQPGANALQVSKDVRATLAELSKSFPDGLKYEVALDTTLFVQASIDEVVKTFYEAVALVVLVVFIFLHSLRLTIIPTLAVPVSILGALAGMLVFGFSINMLTLFGMILAIGL